MIWERKKQESLFISIFAFYICFCFWLTIMFARNIVWARQQHSKDLLFLPVHFLFVYLYEFFSFISHLSTFFLSFSLSISWSLMIFYYTCYSPVFTFHLGLSCFVPFSFFLNLFFITYFLFVFLSISCGSCFSLLGTLFLCCNLEF